jgi:hypothetical protein
MDRRRVVRVLSAAIPAAVAAVVVETRRGGAGSDAALDAGAPTSGTPPAATPDPGSLDAPVQSGEDAAAAPEVVRPTLDVVCRDALGLVPAVTGGVAHRPVLVTIHHSAFVLEDPSRAPAQLRAFQRDHQRRGWVDVAYHRAVDPQGNVYELRNPAIEGDSGTDYDTTGHLQLLCLGDFEQQEPTPAMLEALARLIAAECAARGLLLDTLSAHRDHVLTWCPGEALYARLEEVRARAAELLASGAPTVRTVCGDEAVARIAAIEAGTTRGSAAGS